MRAFLAALILCSCSVSPRSDADYVSNQSGMLDSLSERSEVLRYVDSTSGIVAIQRFLRDSLANDLLDPFFGAGHDSLIDLNGDGSPDYLREYYGASGSGEKNSVYVAVFDRGSGRYRPCAQLNQLANPTFYFDSAQVYGFYITTSGGYATALRWHGVELDTLLDINISVETKEPERAYLFRHEILDFRTGRTTTLFSQQVRPAGFKKYVPLIRGDGSDSDAERVAMSMTRAWCAPISSPLDAGAHSR